jgi:hypothetical protein
LPVFCQASSGDRVIAGLLMIIVELIQIPGTKVWGIESIFRWWRDKIGSAGSKWYKCKVLYGCGYNYKRVWVTLVGLVLHLINFQFTNNLYNRINLLILISLLPYC